MEDLLGTLNIVGRVEKEGGRKGGGGRIYVRSCERDTCCLLLERKNVTV